MRRLKARLISWQNVGNEGWKKRRKRRARKEGKVWEEGTGRSKGSRKGSRF